VVSFTARLLCPPRERTTRILLIGGWVGPRAGLDTVAKGETPALAGD